MQTHLLKRAIDEAEGWRGSMTGNPDETQLEEFDAFIAAARRQLTKVNALRTENNALRTELNKLKTKYDDLRATHLVIRDERDELRELLNMKDTR